MADRENPALLPQEVKARELYKKIFPELRKQHKNKDTKMHSYAAVIPALEERQRKCTSNKGLILDPLKEFNDWKFQNMWTDPEKDIFKEKFLQHPKNFGRIAQNLERKSVSDCVLYYYLTKKSINFKQQLRQMAAAARGGEVRQSGVMTRLQRQLQEQQTMTTTLEQVKLQQESFQAAVERARSKVIQGSLLYSDTCYSDTLIYTVDIT